MLRQIYIRFVRAPMQAIAVVMLAAVLSGSLCGLHAANLAEELHYQQSYDTIPVKLVVTNLSATRSDNLEAPSFVSRAFTSKNVENSLKEYIKDLQIKATQDLPVVQIGDKVENNMLLVGLTDMEISGEMTQVNLITWFDGYDESCLPGEELVCVVPRSMVPEGYDHSEPLQIFSELSFSYMSGPTYYTDVNLTVVGTHTGSETRIYCPYEIVKDIYSALSKPAEIDAIQATLIDNDLQEEVREVANNWFAVPNPTGERTPWDFSFYFYYPYALDIDNDLLKSAEQTMKISMLVNELCAVLVFALSAGASFFIGFLMIRSRKREIALMRTLGTRTVSIFFSFALEQMMCVLLGSFLGGALFGYEPRERLEMFIGIYALGLCLALMLFLGRNLMTTIKEDE